MLKFTVLCSVVVLFSVHRTQAAPLQAVVCNHDGSSCVQTLNGTEEVYARDALYSNDRYEGDMLFPLGKTAVSQRSMLWPSGVVPYSIDSSLSHLHGLINGAINQFHAYTCVKFVPRTTQRNYVDLFSGIGCYSHVGMTSGRQPLSLGRGCHNIGTAVHELSHAIGFYHEQNRSDRDQYIRIYWGNISSAMQSQFVLLSARQNTLLNGFDYKSIMIYGERAFSRDGVSKTMSAKNGYERLTDPFNKPGLTQSDIYRINKLYGCK